MKISLLILFGLLNVPIYAQFQEHIIELPYSAGTIVSTDVDNDMDNDILITGGINKQLTWLENSDGLGNIDMAHPIMSNPYEYVKYLAISDIDQDNDIDILLTTSEQDCGNIRTFKNIDGLGNFQVFSSSMNSCGIQTPIEVADIDGDNDNDWVSSVSASEFGAGKLSWFENNGNGNVTERMIANSFVRSFQLVDVDNDNDTDLIGLNFDISNNPEMFWYENTDGLGNFNKHSIMNNQSLEYYSKLIMADLDNDNDLDIIINYSNTISWYANNGQGNFSSETIINNNNA